MLPCDLDPKFSSAEGLPGAVDSFMIRLTKRPEMILQDSTWLDFRATAFGKSDRLFFILPNP